MLGKLAAVAVGGLAAWYGYSRYQAAKASGAVTTLSWLGGGTLPAGLGPSAVNAGAAEAARLAVDSAILA